MAIRVAIIGAGLIGKKRALSLPKGVTLVAVCDPLFERAQSLAQECRCKAVSDWRAIVEDKNIDALFICTPNNIAAEVGEAAILAGKHILLEKPGARGLIDLGRIERAYKKKKVVVMFGYNHRFHKAMVKAKSLIDSKKYGPVLFIRAKYGHGARLGYDKEWRFNKEVSGGGHLIDQGTHLIDLVNFFYGKAKHAHSKNKTLFWNTKLEDASFLLLEDRAFIAQLSTSCLEWKNVFSFEIMLTYAKIQIDGLGRSYGTERLTHYVMSKKMGPPKVYEFVYDGEDVSWKEENKHFFTRIKNNDISDTALKDARYVLEIIDTSYKQQ
jgi:predicted dehydrogenase